MKIYSVQQRQHGFGPSSVSSIYAIADEHRRHFRGDGNPKKDVAKAGNADVFRGKVDELIAETLKIIDKLLETTEYLQQEIEKDPVAAGRFKNGKGHSANPVRATTKVLPGTVRSPY